MSFTVNLFDWREFRFKVFSNLTAKWILLVFILTQQQHQFVDGKVTQFSKAKNDDISARNLVRDDKATVRPILRNLSSNGFGEKLTSHRSILASSPTSSSFYTSSSSSLSSSQFVQHPVYSSSSGQNSTHLNATTESGLTIERGLINTTEYEGEDVKLRCDFRLSSKGKRGKVKWYKNGEAFEVPKDRVSVKTVEKPIDDYPASKRIVTKLKLIQVNLHDSGYYKCEAFDGRETVESQAILRIQAGHQPLTFSSNSFDSSRVLPYFNGFQSETVSSIQDSHENFESSSSHSSSSASGSCEAYRGSVCSQYLGNTSIYVKAGESQDITERKLREVFSVVKTSRDVSPQCHRFAIPSLCYSSFPPCNAHSDPPQVKLVCRDECEMLLTNVCHLEYTLAKKHSSIAQTNILPSCDNLPAIGSHQSNHCIRLGVPNAIHVTPDHNCFYDDGISYRGTASRSASGTECVPWNHQVFYRTADYPELIGGHNYCRNPGGMESQPWCFVRESEMKRALCDVPKCLDSLWFYLVIPMVGALALFILIVSVICLKNRVRSKPVSAAFNGRNGITKSTSNHGHSPRKINANGKSNSMEMNALLPRKSPKAIEYPMCNIRFIEELGEGCFGKVFRGELIMSINSAVVPIAVKTLKEDANQKTKQDFAREAELMAELQHPNIVCLIGVCFKEEPMSMLFEYMSEGDLHEYLITHSPRTDITLTRDGQKIKVLDINDFLHISTQIGAGMEYLADHHYVHRDLAARNCLVSDHLTVKIADFGLSRDIYASDYYRVQTRSPLPVRWMPPESILYGKYTTESDVWSFGVLLWEIFSYGVQPYYGFSNQQVIEMIRNLQLLSCPAECPLNIYNLMLQCWNEIPGKRPSFSQLHQRLRNWKAVYSNTMASSLQTASTHSSSLITANHNSLISGQYSKTLQHNNSYNHHQHYNSFHLPPPPPLSNNYPTTPTHTTYSYSSLTNTMPSSLDHQNANFNNMNHTHIQQHFNGSSIYGVPFTYDSKMRQAQAT